MFKSLKKGNEQPFDEAQYKIIMHLVSELPTGSGWAATYEKQISNATIKMLTESGLVVLKKTHVGGKVYYKISKDQAVK